MTWFESFSLLVFLFLIASSYQSRWRLRKHERLFNEFVHALTEILQTMNKQMEDSKVAFAEIEKPVSGLLQQLPDVDQKLSRAEDKLEELARDLAVAVSVYKVSDSGN